MKGIVLAGGTGSRLFPLTGYINKHLLPVGRKAMIEHGIDKLKDAGILELLVVTGPHSAGLFTALLGSGMSRNMSITFRIQDRAGGIAEALGLAEGYIRPGEKCLVLLADNLFEDRLAPFVEDFVNRPAGAKVLLKRVADPRRYGVPEFDGKHIVRIVEKPAAPPSPYCVTGIYMYDSTVFDRIRTLEPSDRGEMEITDINNMYAREGRLSYGQLSGWWSDAGTFSSLQEANARFAKRKGGER